MSKRKEQTVEHVIRNIVNPKPRRVRVKSAMQVEYEKMLADYKVNGAAHLASAKAKMGAK